LAEEEFGGAGAPAEEAASSGGGEPSSPQEQAMALVDTLKKSLPLIIVLLVVIAGVYVYMFVLPKPGTVTVNVYEMDMGDKPFSAAEVEISDDNSNVVAQPELDEGVALATDVPPGKLTILVTPSSPTYAKGRATVNLESGKTASTAIQIAKAADLAFKGSISSQNIGAGCSKTFSIPLANNGGSAFDAELVAEPDAFNSLFSYDGVKTIDAGSEATFSVTVNAPAEDQKFPDGSKIRVKYTNVAMDFSANVVEAPEMRVDPSEISIRCGDKGCEDVQVTINNYGKSDLTEVKYVLAGGVTEADVDIVGFESKPIKPNARTTFFIRGKASGVGKVGKLKIESGCGEEELPLSIRAA